MASKILLAIELTIYAIVIFWSRLCAIPLRGKEEIRLLHKHQLQSNHAYSIDTFTFNLTGKVVPELSNIFLLVIGLISLGYLKQKIG